MSDAPPVALDPHAALAQAVRQFNAWRFWDCHETLEDLWRDAPARGQGGETAPADFYQGIIKVAAGFHHLLRAPTGARPGGNHKGAVTLLSGGLALLEPFRPSYMGVDVRRIVDEVRPCLERIRELGPRRLSQFDRSLIPALHYDPEAAGAG